MKSYDGRLNRVDRKQQEQVMRENADYEERVLLIYADGREEKTYASVKVVSEIIAAYFDWCSYVEGERDKPPELVKAIYVDSDEVWNFEEDARKPPMTEDEAYDLMAELDRLAKETEMKMKGRKFKRW